MTLDDFFTLTEMNNGLTSPSRVRELVAVMQKENDCVLKNIGDSTRQWSAVASAIAATENKDCLDLFIQLDGLRFLDKWLKDAQNFRNDVSDSFVEETITQLLRALEKLHVDYETLVASGIWSTIKGLLVHSSPMVHNKARDIFGSWERKQESDASVIDSGKTGGSTDSGVGRTADVERGSGLIGSSQVEASLCKETSSEEKGLEQTTNNPVLSASSDVAPTHSETEQPMPKRSEPFDKDSGPLNHVGSPSLSKPQELKHIQETKGSPERVVSLEESKMVEERSVAVRSDAADATKPLTRSSSQKCPSALDKGSLYAGSLYINSSATDSKGKDAMDSSDRANQSRSFNSFSTKAGGDLKHPMLRKSFSSDKSLINKLDLHTGEVNIANNYSFAKKEMNVGSDHTGKKTDVELDYGIVDPLEVALQVAIEVERQVVDCREHSCSSSEKIPEGNLQQPDSPDAMSRKQSHGSEGTLNEVANDLDSSGEASPMQDESATSSETLDVEQTNEKLDIESSQVTEAAPEEVNAQKEICNFDLNQDICCEDGDHSGNQFLTSISIVSASRAAAAPEQPVAPLQFGGNLGWKGSAATSAFRPASPRRNHESDRDLSTGGSSGSSKQQKVCLDIDLNVAETVDRKTGESSLETNSRRSEHLELDLNRASEDGGVPSDSRIMQFFPQGNGHQSRSHSSSSSSKQPYSLNFDLNGRPSFLNDSSNHSYLSHSSQNLNISGGIKSDDSVISIMGTRVHVNRKDVPQTLPLPNGRVPELAFDVNDLGRPGGFLGIGSVVPYTHPPVYGLNNVVPGPSMSFPYGSGGPIPYMMDSRGAPVIPQLVGSASGLPTAFSQPPFVLNMTSSSTSNGVGPSRSSFDLNSGMMVESGSGEPAGFRQFLNVKSTDDQLRSNALSSMSSVGGKRKEPENGWEQYPFRHFTPWKQ